jgi:hypothetical protein
MVYLDQSTVSSLALEDDYEDLREFLREHLEAGQLICPRSLEHQDETVLAGAEQSERIRRLSDGLSDGVEFRPGSEIVWAEIHVIAAAFCGDETRGELWQEAFESDPQTPRDDLYMEFMGGKIRVGAHFGQNEDDQAEVEWIKGIEQIAQGDYERVRADELDFDQATDLFFTEMLARDLGVLFAPKAFEAERQRRAAEQLQAMDQGNLDLGMGSAYSRHQAYYHRKVFTEKLIERYPAVADRVDDFRLVAREIPSLRFPALLRAALAVHPERRAKSGDGYDIEHLTRGVSRCDVVTADSAMVQRAEEHGLVPAGCDLIRTADQQGLRQAIERRLPK